MKYRIGIAILVFGALLGSATVTPAAPGQMQDSSRRLYDRIMEEFKHRDYEAALAGFRFLSKYTATRHSQPMHNIGSESVNTAWADTRMPWPPSTTSYLDSSEAELARKAIDTSNAKADPISKTPE